MEKKEQSAPLSPKEQKVEDIKKTIENERKNRLSLIDGIKRMRRRIAYKQSEYEALSKLVTIQPEKTKSIGYLKRMKERLEFKISTEASSLSAEKELIRRINDIDAELDRAIKSYKLKKKLDLINGDLVDINKQIEEQEKKILESNKALDELYANLRSLTGYKGGRKQSGERKPGGRPQKNAEISLADIAVMKEKKNGDLLSNNDLEMSSN
jgi:uncharacterized coiled-coil DUF342 family protein